MKKQILKNAAVMLLTAMTAMPGLAQLKSLVPSTPYAGKTYDYFCTFKMQCFTSNNIDVTGTGSPRMRAMMVEDNLFGTHKVYPDGTNTLGDKLYDRYMNWASFYPMLHGDLYFLLDDSWDIDKSTNGRNDDNYGGKGAFATDILNLTRFPSFDKGSATADMKALVDKVKGNEYGWKGLGLWVACDIPAGRKDDESYWKARLQELNDAGVGYLKVDWDISGNSKSRGINYRHNISDWGQQVAPNLTLEHATFQGLSGEIPDVVNYSEVTRTYDVDNNISEAQTINRIAQILKGNYKPYHDGWGIINCEDEPYIAAGLGCAIGIMRHPLAGAQPDGGTDEYFGEFPNQRRMKHRLNEVVRAIHWHRIAQPFGIGGSYELSKNADGSDATMTENSNLIKNNRGQNETKSQRTYNRVSRGMDIPTYTDETNAISFDDDGNTAKANFGDRPFILASHYPSGATAVAAVSRYKMTNGKPVYYRVGIDVTLQPPTNKEPVGIFGYYNELTIKYKDGLPAGNIKVYAQDLADDKNAPTDITNLVTLNQTDGSLAIKGTTINDLCKNNKYPYDEVKTREGLTDVDYTDVSDPAIVLQVVGDGALNVEGDKLEAENAEQYNREDKTNYPTSQALQLGDDIECSGGKYVKWLAYGNQLNFNYVAKAAGTYTLNIYYLSDGNRSLNVYVNGKMSQIAADQLPATASLTTGTPSKYSVDIALAKGNNTISLGNITGQAPNIDCISLQAKDVTETVETATHYFIKNKGQEKYVKTGGKAKTPDTPLLVNDDEKVAQVLTKNSDGTYTICDPEFAPQGWGIQGRNTIYESNNGGTKTNSWGTTLIPGFKFVDTGDGDGSYYIYYTWGKWTSGRVALDVDPSNKDFVLRYGDYDLGTSKWSDGQKNDVTGEQIFGGLATNLTTYGDDAKWYLEVADGKPSDIAEFSTDGRSIEEITLNSSDATYSSNKALDFSNVEGLKAYSAVDVDGNTVKMQEVGAVPANTGVYLKGEAGKTYRVPVAANATAPEGNLLQPAVGYTRVYPTNDAAPHAYDGGTFYNLMLQHDDATGYYFVRFTYPLTFGLNHAYLQLSKQYFETGSDAKHFTISFGDAPTAISTVTVTDSPASDTPVYDLQGRRVSGTPQHGIYIKGGKKFVVK